MANAGPLQNGNIRNSTKDRCKAFKNTQQKHSEQLKGMRTYLNSYNNYSNRVFK